MNNKTSHKSLPSSYNRIVIKFGTSLLTGGSNYLDQEIMSNLAFQVAKLHKRGLELLIVSSGAIASGRDKLGLREQPKGIPFKQVLAAVGQSHLMYIYEQLFSKYHITIAQALLTKAELSDRADYLNARNTLLALLEMRVLCIANENDVIAMDEIQEAKFGDNDNLSAMIANLIDADLLLLLSDTSGLYTADPRENPHAQLIPKVDRIDPDIERLASGTSRALGVGGMITKIEAAKLANSSGVTVIIANGNEPDVISRIIAGESLGTLFIPTSTKLESRKRWMLSGLSTKGNLMVDNGAAKALKRQKRSLLAAGIKQIEGEFQRGDIVNICKPDGLRIGCGITNYSSVDIKVIKGAHSKDIVTLLSYDYGSEVVHRNNLVIL